MYHLLQEVFDSRQCVPAKYSTYLRYVAKGGESMKNNNPAQLPEITIKITPAELSTNDDVIGYCKKISEELAATSKLRLEVELKV